MIFLKDVAIDIVVAFAVFLMVGSAVRRPVSESICEPTAAPVEQASATAAIQEKSNQ